MSRSHLCKISSLARRRKTVIFSFEFVALAHSAEQPWKAEVCEEGVLWIVKLAPWNVAAHGGLVGGEDPHEDRHRRGG